MRLIPPGGYSHGRFVAAAWYKKRVPACKPARRLRQAKATLCHEKRQKRMGRPLPDDPFA
jgi:hypothetical protein